MKTFHIEAEEGQIAKTVLMPGDPMRAKYIAEHYLTDVICYSQVRGMNGYTGYYNGKKVSVQGSGMGIPSMGIYSYELFNTFGVNQIIRVGTCGGMEMKVKGGDIVVATGAIRMEGTSREYAPIEFPAVSDFDVAAALAEAARAMGKRCHMGVVQCKDSFYGQHEPENMPAEPWLKARWEAWRRGNVISSEMESAAIFVISSIRGCRASSVMAYTEMPKSVEVAVGALRILIEQDKAAEK